MKVMTRQFSREKNTPAATSTIASRLFAIAALAIISLSHAAYADFDEIIVFGDNMSDTGNRAVINSDYDAMTSEPPYNKSRQSNGLLMVEHFANFRDIPLVASRLNEAASGNAGTNFAMTGARAADVGLPNQNRHRLSEQVEQYAKRTPPDDNTLIIIAIGTNDVVDTLGSDENAAATRRELATEAIKVAVEDLIELNARHFVVVNVANIVNLPATQALIADQETEELRETLAQRAEDDSSAFNTELSDKLTKLVADANATTPADDTDNIELVLFDLFSFTEEILDANDDAAEQLRLKLGIDNFKDACYRPNNAVKYHPECGEQGANINDFVFFDQRQVTDTIHGYMGEKLDEIVPEPECEGCPVTPDPVNPTNPPINVDPALPLFSNGSAIRMIRENPNPNATGGGGSSSGGGSSGGGASGSGGAAGSDIVYVNGVAGRIRWPSSGVPAESARSNPRFDPNYLTEQGMYTGPLWYPL